MLTKEQNELLTRVGPGTPGGDMLRRYWLPAALSVEVPPGGAPLPVRLLGEDLVLFRDEQGRLGLLALHCSHRGADLSYGRIEDGGIRCIYHGWLYDIHGNCLEQPGASNSWTYSADRGSAESAGLEAQAAGLASQSWRRPQDGPAQMAAAPSRPAEGQRLPAAYQRIKHPAYPCHEVAGVVFAYLGPSEPPLFPNYELFRVPESHRWIHKQWHECNYLQANEGNIDSVHVRFLHRYLPGGRYRRAREFNDDGDEISEALPSSVPKCEETHFGVRIYSFHDASDGTYVRTSNFVMPVTCAVPGGPAPPGDGHLMNWHVPIDDTHHWRYSMAFKRSGPINPDYARARASVTGPDYRSPRNKANRYLQDREEQRYDTYAGMGPIFVVQDSCVTETTGEIQDRTREHLAATDAPIAAARRRMLRAIKDVQEGRDPPHVLRDPKQQDRLLEMRVWSERLLPGTTWDEYRAQRGAPSHRRPSASGR